MTNIQSDSVVMALDYGVKKMGVAVGNILTSTAQPLQIMPMDNGQPNWDNLLHLLKEWSVDVVLVGLPLHIDGTESHLSKRATKFAKRLNHKLKEQGKHLTFFMVDERLSSNLAKDPQSTEAYDDKSAYIILESWLHDPYGNLLA